MGGYLVIEDREPVLSLVLPSAPVSATQARRAVVAAVAGWGFETLLDDAAAVVTELVGNAVLHAASAVEVRAQPEGGGLRIEVTDSSPVLPAPSTPDGDTLFETGTTGRGLRLVAALASDWGIEAGDGGKTVWAELGTTPNSPAHEVTAAPSAPRARSRDVCLPAVPIRLLRDMNRYYDDVHRELQLGAFKQRSDLRLALERSGQERLRAAAAAAIAASGPDGRVDWTFAVELDAVSDIRGAAEALDRVSDLARRGEFLTPPGSAELVAFRHWCANEIARQLAGRPPSSCPFDERPAAFGASGDHDGGLRDARLRSLIEAAELDVWRADATGALVTDMPEWRGHTGQRGEEVLGTGWLDAVHPDHRARVAATWQAALDAGDVYQCEYPIVAPDGSVRVIVARGAPVRADGAVREWVGTTVDVSAQRAAERQLAERAELLDMLQELGQALATIIDLQPLLQRLTEVTTVASRAQFGAFFFNAVDEYGEAYSLYTLHGAPRSAFSRFPMPRNTPIFEPTFKGDRIVRYDDVMAAAEYGTMPEYRGMPSGHLPVRSYLAVPVVSPTGRVHGGLFFGHADVGVFGDREERIVVAIAAQAAIGIDNAMLYERERTAVVALQRSLLPAAVPSDLGLSVATRYLPGLTGMAVGGDWYDAHRVAPGRVVLSVGDVQGKGANAAGLMGQLRAVARAHMLTGAGPDEALGLLDTYWTAEANVLATALLVVVDDRTGRCDIASAGHLPPVVIRAGGAELLSLEPGPPLGVGLGGYGCTMITLEPGDGLVLFTDGLVERAGRPGIDAGLDGVVAGVSEATRGSWNVAEVADGLATGVVRETQRDDIAVLVARRP